MFPATRLLLAGALALVSTGITGDRGELPSAEPNSNRHPAGRLRHDTLRVALEVRMATWAPEGERGARVSAAAFGEQGKTPLIPGPLLRVPTGTVLDATVRNSLPDSTITVHGLGPHPAPAADSLVIEPGGLARVRFAAGAPGTYLYYAEAGRQDTLVEREQLAGAFVVDSAGPRPDDRIFVINIWGEPVDSTGYRNALAINGRSFPFDERVTTRVGDTLRWRWINASQRNHPMHLHGFYFRVDAKGDSIYRPAARRVGVTENLPPRSTMSITWSPDRPGNWLFHCHLMFHALADARLSPLSPDPHHEHDGDMARHMAGLVLGIEARPGRGWREPARANVRALRLFVQEGRARMRAPRALGFVLQRGPEPPPPDSVEIPAGVLVLTRGEPTDITVINRLAEPAAVHWHGLELESWSDGVAGWSGSGHRTAPAIQPGDSFTARLTLRRAGTFIYHTHLNDLEQLTSGLYGAIVVLEPGRRFDPATDHVWVAGWDGPRNPPHIIVNGDSTPPPLELVSRVTHRLRFVNIGMAVRLRFALAADSGLVTWRPVAKDGADLPPAQAAPGPAALFLAVGETADAEFQPPGPGTYRLTATAPNGRVVWGQSLVVR
jgi:FtsP/CotA-like multicopper oxidase with cupredoxin domain